MDRNKEKIMNIQKADNWGIANALHLMKACNDEYTINDLAYDVQRGCATLFNVHEQGLHVASMVLRLDDKELVVQALGGKNTSGDLIQSLCDFWDDLAKQNNVQTIRAHVSRKGMAKLMERAGGKLTEYVYRKAVL